MGSYPICHPANPKFRFIFLAFLCFLTFGSYWCYDIPDAIQTPLKAKFNLDPNQYALLYSVYNFMNIGIVLFGGYFIDVIGLRPGAILFCFLIALGQVVFSIGGSISNITTAYYVMLAGRIIFSLGGESLSVAQSTFCSRWFKGSELAFSFGVTLSFSRVGSFTNLQVTPLIADSAGVSAAIWVGSLTCLVSLVLTVIASASDKVKEKHERLDSNEPEKPQIPFRIKDILYFPPSLWLIYLICVCYYIPIFTIVSISGASYVEATLGLPSDGILANRYLSIPYIMSAGLAPFCGFAVDKVGLKPLWLSITSGMMVATYVILLYLIDIGVGMLIFAMIILGFSYSLCAASLWPCVPLLVPEERVGTAYAIMNSIQNGGLAIAGLVAANLGCSDPTSLEVACNTKPIYFLGCVAIAATGLSILLFIYDLGHGRVLSNKIVKASDVSETSRLIGDTPTAVN